MCRCVADRGLWLFLTLPAGPSSNPGVAAGFAMADATNWSKGAPNPSFVESIDDGGASSPLRAFPRHSPSVNAECGQK